MEDLDLRRRLAALEDSLGGTDIQPPLIRTHGNRQIVIAIVAMVAALVIAVPLAQVRDWLGAPTQPQGLYVGSGVLGGQEVGQAVCAAVELSDASYADGQATVHWWTTGGTGCRSRASGITTQTAVIKFVTPPVSTGGQDNAIRVAFPVQTIPVGSVDLAFILDPSWNAANDTVIPAWRVTDVGQPSLVFERASELAIPGPDDEGPLATPVFPDRISLPVGTFQAVRPFDGMCLAITVTDPGETSISALWWDAGASGDCTTRTSDVVSSVAHLIEFPLMRVDIPLMDGGVHELTLRFTGMTDDEIRFARANEMEVSFLRVNEVAPTFAPVP